MMILFVLIVGLKLLVSNQAPSDISDLDRFLREISVESSDNQTLPENYTQPLNMTNQTLNQSDDPEADQFIEDLRKLVSSENETTVNISENEAKDLGNSTRFTMTEEEKVELMEHQNILYIPKLNGSSFRIQLLINDTWDKDMNYPSNLKYALMESNVSSAFNKAYENYIPFVNFHLLSFNYRNNSSYFCDFILNFQNKSEHMEPFLKMLLRGNADGIPILIDSTNAYVIEMNKTRAEFCHHACDEHECLNNFCPPECCAHFNQTSHMGNAVPEIPLVETPSNSSKNQSETKIDQFDWPYNSSTIHDEMMNVVDGMSLNESTSGTHDSGSDQSGKESSTLISYAGYPDYTNYFNGGYNPESYSTSVIAGLSNALPNTGYENPVNQNFLSGNAEASLSPYEVDKRAKIPSYSYDPEQTRKTNIGINAITNLYPTNMPMQKPPTIKTYYPNMYQPNQERTYVPSVQSNEKNLLSGGRNIKIWYPKLK